MRTPSGPIEPATQARSPAARRAIAAPSSLMRAQLVGQAEVGELEAVGAERVGLDDVGARVDVLAVHVGDEVRLREVQLVEAAIEEDAPRVEHRAHRAVADEHAPIELGQKPLHQRDGCGSANPARDGSQRAASGWTAAGTSRSSLSQMKSLLL